jgi:hypothetical protein
MGLVDHAKHGIEDVREATPEEIKEKARETAASARKAAEDAAELAAMTANAALSAAKSGRQAYIQTRAEGGSVAEAAGDATREAIDSSQHAVAEQED